MQVRITSNAKAASAWVDQIHRKQIPFAQASALNEVAFSVRRAGLDELDRGGMKIRNQGLRRRALAVEKATKRQEPAPFAVVGVPKKFGFLDLQAEGGRKRARGQFVAVPTKLAKRSRTAAGKMRKSNKPATFRNKKGKGIDATGRRLRVFGGRSRAGKLAQRGVGIWYHLVRSARVKKSWRFRESAELTFRRDYSAAYRRAFAQAVRTAR